MKIKISEAKKVSDKILKSYGFTDEQTKLITKNLLEAELSGKPSHGFIRLPAIKNQLNRGNVSLGNTFKTISESANHLHLDGKKPSRILSYV